MKRANGAQSMEQKKEIKENIKGARVEVDRKHKGEAHAHEHEHAHAHAHAPVLHGSSALTAKQCNRPAKRRLNY